MGKFYHGSAVAVLLLMVALGGAAEQPRPGRGAAINLEQLRPRWAMGDRWVIETRSLLLQTRDAAGEQLRSQPIPWQFTVQRFEKVLDDDCYRIEVRCLLDEGRAQPASVLWVDRKSQTVRQISTQVPVPGGFRVITENYEAPNGQAAPVLGPLTALPLDLPAMQAVEAKGLDQKYQYTARIGPAGVKDVGEIGFAYEVEQEVVAVPAEEAKSLLDDGFTKDLQARPAVEVRLKRYDRQVRQLWRADLPWPAFTDDGRTTSKLIKVEKAQP